MWGSQDTVGVRWTRPLCLPVFLSISSLPVVVGGARDSGQGWGGPPSTWGWLETPEPSCMGGAEAAPVATASLD